MTWKLPNLDELFEEDDLLIRGFEAQGFRASPIVWSDPDIDWDRFDVALIRSTWDYLDEPERFVSVLSQIEASSCKLYNPLAAVRWNMDKHYLFELEKLGVPIIPTCLVSDFDGAALREMVVSRQWQSVILKPTVGLGGSDSYRLTPDELADWLTSLKAGQRQREYMLQPFIESVVTEGELSFVYFDGQLSHALLKKPAEGDYRVQGIYGGTVRPIEPRPQDRLQAESVLTKLPNDILYARIDLIRMEGRLRIVEVELIEPILSFNLVPDAIARLVDATRAQLERRP